MTVEGITSKARIRLQVLCDTVPTIVTPWVPDIYVAEYQNILGDLRDGGIDIQGFEIPESITADADRGCDRQFFIMKLSGLLLHLASAVPRSIGPDPAMSQRIRAALSKSDDDDVPF